MGFECESGGRVCELKWCSRSLYALCLLFLELDFGVFAPFIL